MNPTEAVTSIQLSNIVPQLLSYLSESASPTMLERAGIGSVVIRRLAGVDVGDKELA